MQARIAVRLNHGDHPPLCALASSSEHRPDFHGVMAVIVNDSRLAPGQIDFANVREAPLDAAELGKAVLDRCIINAQMQRNANSRHGVEDIMTAGHGHFRSEEHTSELQSLMRISYAVFCLKKKQKNK